MRQPSATTLPLLLAAPLLAFAAPATAQDGFSWNAGSPELRLDDGAVRLSPVLRLDADAGSYWGQDEPDGFRSGTNLRRGRVGFDAELPGDFEASFVWDFGSSSPGNASDLYEAQIAWSGLGWATIRGGAFQPSHMLERSSSSFDLLFMERAMASNLATSVSSGDRRLGVGLEAHGARWTAAGYLLGGNVNVPQEWGQRGVAARATALPLDLPGMQAQLGGNFAWQFRPGSDGGYSEASLGDHPELRVDSREFLDTGSVDADNIWAAGPEFAFATGRFYGQAEYQWLVFDTPEDGSRTGTAWYGALSYTLLGQPRQRDAEAGSWKRPRGEGAFNPMAGDWGALELAGRYSEADLRDGPVQGGAQRIWTGGVNWYPASWLKVMLNYQNGRIVLPDESRDFEAIGMRLSFNL
ncbi:OprO/OprP family phosphate-selective porin [Pseudoroseomonas globiformis]|uniref:OprO/OprP family phosphate-selective porin n=1 Tax=Teichococcus globiformis TaxID=2307229 RepID=A0ABV7G656_9PROT